MQEGESKTKRERLSSSRNLNAHIADGPLSSLDLEGAAPHLSLHIWLLLRSRSPEASCVIMAMQGVLAVHEFQGAQLMLF